jgi:hypothetical protein
LWARAAQTLSRLCLNESVVYEIRNSHTGELAPGEPRYTDGTAADRAARKMGREWRVYYAAAESSEGLLALGRALTK